MAGIMTFLKWHQGEKSDGGRRADIIQTPDGIPTVLRITPWQCSLGRHKHCGDELFFSRDKSVVCVGERTVAGRRPRYARISKATYTSPRRRRQAAHVRNRKEDPQSRLGRRGGSGLVSCLQPGSIGTNKRAQTARRCNVRPMTANPRANLSRVGWVALGRYCSFVSSQNIKAGGV